MDKALEQMQEALRLLKQCKFEEAIKMQIESFMIAAEEIDKEDEISPEDEKKILLYKEYMDIWEKNIIIVRAYLNKK